MQTEPSPGPRPGIAVIGGGPAGLAAAESLAAAGAAVTVFEQMPSPARKLLIAGRGGLNLTHSEPLPQFLARYGAARHRLEPAIAAFPPEALIGWCHGLGQETFTGSSGRVFPRALKASPLLRAWLGRLAGLGVELRPRHRWQGWDAAGALAFATPEGAATLRPAATLLALGGASWPRLGSDGTWTALLPETAIAPFQPANCGFAIAWSEHFRRRFEGQPLKRIALAFDGARVRGEAVVTATGIEGGAVYALSATLREAIAARGPVVLHLDLRPDLSAESLARRLDGPRGGQSLANLLRRAGLPPVGIGLVQEALRGSEAGLLASGGPFHGSGQSPAPIGPASGGPIHGTRQGPAPIGPASGGPIHGSGRSPAPMGPLSRLVKALPLRLTAPQPIARAISSAGGVAWGEVDARFMLRRRPGLFLAGEMLDWEAPTGGYLLQACFSTGIAAATGLLDWLAEARPGRSPP